MRDWMMALAASAALATAALLATAAASPASATSPLVANGDYPYWKLNTAQYDTTYEAIDAQARHYAYFRWDGDAYCRYPTGWQGPGAYHVGDRLKPGQGWDAAYPWQGPGVEADHDGAESPQAYQAEYAHAFGTGPFCEVHRARYHRHRVVLRRKD